MEPEGWSLRAIIVVVTLIVVIADSLDVVIGTEAQVLGMDVTLGVGRQEGSDRHQDEVGLKGQVASRDT